LGHNGLGIGLNLTPNGAVAINSQVGVSPCAAGVAISIDGQTLVVANYYNDSITVFTGGLGHWSKLSELDLRPGKSDPRCRACRRRISVLGGCQGYRTDGDSVCIQHSRPRDRGGEAERAAGRRGPDTSEGQPNKMTLNAAQTLLYVAVTSRIRWT